MASSDTASEIPNVIEMTVATNPPVVGSSTNNLKETSKTLELTVTLFSLILYVADICTDSILGVQYVLSGHLDWGILTITLCVVPSIITQAISWRWFIVEPKPVPLRTKVLHLLMLGVIERYFLILHMLLKSQKKVQKSDEYSGLKLNQHQSDICLLRLFESFLESAPQLLLQLYVMHEMGTWHFWTGLSAFASLVSLAWGIASYARTMRNVREDKARITLTGMVLQACWRTGTVMARIVSLFLCASVIHTWVLLALGIHWLGMTVWVIRQKTDLCSTAWEERVYNAVVGVIYCFCFFNLKEGQSRHRAMIFYTITAAENGACLAIFMRFSQPHENDRWLHAVAPVLIVAGSLLGHSSQLIYYRWFHPAGPIKMGFSSSNPEFRPEALESGPPPSVQSGQTLRTLKYTNAFHKFSGVSLPSLPPDPTEHNEIIKGIENHALSTDENLSIDIMDTNPKNLTEPDTTPCGETNRMAVSKSDSKLLGIELELNFEFPSYQMLLTAGPKSVVVLKNSKSDGQISRESLEKRLKDLLDSNTSDEALSEVASSFCVSIHDYENMAAINVNRTDWGIRHWRAYSDIEASCHDNSVCRERDDPECSLTSASGSDVASLTPISDSTKISIQEAISQLKSLAVNGYNIYQPSNATTNEPQIYECLWQPSEESIILVPANLFKKCPTNGHNLSIISEESDIGSVISKSRSSLVSTVDTIMDASSVDEETEQLTYMEVSFLSKLGPPNEANLKATRPKRQFSIIREKFEQLKNPTCQSEKDNLSTFSHCNPSKKTSLSSNARIFIS